MRLCSFTGISKIREKKVRNRLTPKTIEISLWILFSMFGCLTFIATFFPCNFPAYTWLTDPEAIGVESNSSKKFLILIPYTLSNIFYVSLNSCWGAYCLKGAKPSAILSPKTSLRWLRYWKSLIQTTPALSIHDTKILIHIYRVIGKTAKGMRNREGINMTRSSKNLYNFLKGSRKVLIYCFYFRLWGVVHWVWWCDLENMIGESKTTFFEAWRRGFSDLLKAT